MNVPVLKLSMKLSLEDKGHGIGKGGITMVIARKLITLWRNYSNNIITI